MNVFTHELKTNSRSMLIWTGSYCILMIVFMSMYPALASDIDLTKKIFESLPSAVSAAFGISMHSFFTVFGLYSYVFTFLLLAGAVQAIHLGLETIAKEERAKTADFLMTKPISRKWILTSKLLAATTVLLITNAFFILSAYITIVLFSSNNFSVEIFCLITLTLFYVQIFFLALGVLLSVMIPKIKSIISVSLPVVFSFFIIGTLGAIIGDNRIRYITPFKFFDYAYIIQHNSYEFRYILLEIFFIVIAITLSYVLYNKKDVRAAS